jgi:ribonuclease P protein component
VRHFIVFVSARAPSETPTRLGITVTRKIGNAVARNRIKRLVREVFRLNRERLPEGLDVVWVAKQQAAQACFADVLEDFEALVRRPELKTGTRSRERTPAGAR